MKKLFLLFIALCALTVAQAQVVSSYTMQATQGTYTEITDGTVMDLTGLDLTVEDPLTGVAWYPHGVVTESTTAAGFPIGFDFTFNDMACNQFIIGANGYIALGRDEITNDPSHKQHIVSREEGVLLAKEGKIRGVGIAHNKNTEYLKSIPDGKEGNNLSSLPTVNKFS